MSMIEKALAHAEAGLDGARERWFDLLRIPSISANPAHAGDCAHAADWVAARLRDIGFTAAIQLVMNSLASTDYPLQAVMNESTRVISVIRHQDPYAR